VAKQKTCTLVVVHDEDSEPVALARVVVWGRFPVLRLLALQGHPVSLPFYSSFSLREE
jgi:hypothetical protein